jgi:hypothetical protein
LNTYLKLDSITVSFRDESGRLCSLRKAKNYKRERPKSWNDQDFYLVVHADGEAYVNIEGDGAVILNEESAGNLPLKDVPLKKATNKFVVTSNGKIYTFTVHLVTVKASQNADEPESGTRAISYNFLTIMKMIAGSLTTWASSNPCSGSSRTHIKRKIIEKNSRLRA